VAESKATAGYFRSGLPYNRSGQGPRPLVVFQGLLFENKPQPGLMVRFIRFYKFLEEEYTVFEVLRRPGMPRGYTMKDMADDYARMIREEFGGPVDVIGVSTGVSIAQYFAADHPDVFRRLVIHSSAYALSDEAKRLQMRVRHLAQQRRWVKASAVMLGPVIPDQGVMKYLSRPIVWLASLLLGLLAAPKDPSDLVITVEAEDKHDFKDRLGEISAPRWSSRETGTHSTRRRCSARRRRAFRMPGSSFIRGWATPLPENSSAEMSWRF
jgi:pimeloyl-ACP methyl ester carboxylesterase